MHQLREPFGIAAYALLAMSGPWERCNTASALGRIAPEPEPPMSGVRTTPPESFHVVLAIIGKN